MYFQYPLSDRTRCNCSPLGGGRVPVRSFSIPYRIELAVTVRVLLRRRVGFLFQYPLSDRTRCNATENR